MPRTDDSMACTVSVAYLPVVVVVFVIVVMAVAYFNWNDAVTFMAQIPSSKSKANHRAAFVPFVVTGADEPDWAVLRKSLDTYRIQTLQALEQLSMALEVVVAAEEQGDRAYAPRDGRQPLLFSDHLQAKIQRLSDIYERDALLLQRLVLVPFPTVRALPNAAAVVPLSAPLTPDEGNEMIEHRFTWWSSSSSRAGGGSTLSDAQRPYDSVRQVVSHLVRDWSANDGAPIRASLYRWCVVMLTTTELYHPVRKLPILVPGAGLGRLAWELATNLDCAVEAIESSISMAAAAHAILHCTGHHKSSSSNSKRYSTIGSFDLHPYAADTFTNEVDSSTRYDAVRFPDVDPTVTRGSLSYTVGGFDDQSMHHLRNHYGAVVTCFFVDTATTVYDYLTTIALVLTPGGIWLNVGPLHWHVNSQVPVSVDELRMIVECFTDASSTTTPSTGTTTQPVFEILQWSVDDQPVRYRDEGRRRRSTHFDAYCPLRFVVRKRKL